MISKIRQGTNAFTGKHTSVSIRDIGHQSAKHSLNFRTRLSNIFAVLLILLQSSFIFASENWSQIEVATSSGKNLVLLGIAEKLTLAEYSSPKRCSLVAATKSGVNNTFQFRNVDYDFSLNPTVAVSPKTGDGYAICMSAKKDYSKGQLDLFKYETKVNRWTRIATPIEKANGIPDKPVIAIADDGTALVAYLDISKNGAKLKSDLKVFQLSGRGQILKTFAVDAPEGAETSFGIDGQQGADLVYDTVQKRFLLSYGSYGGKDVIICTLDLENGSCKKQVKIEIAKIEVPISRLAVSKRGDVGLTVYDAHNFGDGAAYRFEAQSLKTLSEKYFKNVTMVIPYFKNEEFNFFYLQQDGRDLHLSISDNCKIAIGSRFEKNDYTGAYASVMPGSKEISLIVPTPQGTLKTVGSKSCNLSGLNNKPNEEIIHGVQ